MLFCRSFFRTSFYVIPGCLFCLIFLISCSNQTKPVEQVATSPHIVNTAALTATFTPTLTPTPTETTTPLPPKILGEKPAPRSASAMAYDIVRHRIVLVGGSAKFKTLNDTWEYNGQQWTLIGTDLLELNNPPLLAYDEHRHKMVLLDWYPSTIWEYDGKNWLQIATPTQLSPIWWPAIAYHPVLQKMVIFGELNDGSPYETWLYDGFNVEMIDSSDPYWDWSAEGEGVHRIILPGMLYEPNQQEIILQPTYGWTFALQDNTWAVRLSRQESNLPNCDFRVLLCIDPKLVYDKHRNLIVLFDGVQTWEYAGENWLKIKTETSPSPSPRRGHALAYDEARGVTVLFGGTTEDGIPLNDTWEYDGVTWVER